MPCRVDDEEYSRYELSQASQKIAKQERELCEARSVICNLHYRGLLSDQQMNMNPNLANRIAQQVSLHQEHRSDELQYTINQIKNKELDPLQSKINKIRQLGGTPGKELIEKTRQIEAKIKDLKSIPTDDRRFWDREAEGAF